MSLSSRLIPYLVIDKNDLTKLRHFRDSLSLAQFVAGMTTDSIHNLIIVKFEIRLIETEYEQIEKCRNENGAFSLSTLADYFHLL